MAGQHRIIPILTPQDAKRFWAKVRRGTPDECWEWTACRGKKGYGDFGIQNTVYRAHRIAFALMCGPLPLNLCVLHECDNPPCVNPSHLWLGTVADNQRDMVAKGRQAKGQRSGAYLHPETIPRGEKHWMRRHPEWIRRGEDSWSRKLTADDVRQIRRLYATGEWLLTDLAAKFGVTFSNIGYIVRGKTWKNVS